MQKIKYAETPSLCLLLVACSFAYLSASGANATRTVEPLSIPGTVINGYGFGYDEANRLAKDGVFIGSDSKNNYLDLAYGNVLLRPEKDITVGTCLAKVGISSGALVFIIDSGKDLLIYDLRQTKPVSVIVGKYKLLLEPGRVLMLTGDTTKDFAQLAIGCQSINYSNIKPLVLDKGAVHAFVGDFSMASAMSSIQPLKRLYDSGI